MKTTPKILISLTSFSMICSLNAALILPSTVNENALSTGNSNSNGNSLINVGTGIRVTADFDWNATNILNNKSYFSDHTNFFTHEDNFFSNGKGRIIYDSESMGFLNAKKFSVNNERHGKSLKSFAPNEIINAGVRNYNNFGNAKSYSLSSNDTFTGIGAGTGNGVEKFEIYGGTTGQNVNVSIAFREKAQNESWGHHRTAGHDETSPVGHSPLVGNVMRLHGMGIQDATSDGRIKTNPFALEAYYTDEDYALTFSQDELTELINGCLFLGWLNTSIDGDGSSVTDADRWVHAVQGNYDNMPDNANRHDEHAVIGQAIIGTLQEYIDGTATSIEGLYKNPGELRVGDHGGNPDTNVVWAILDHNSDFAVVPEPSTYALIGGIICLISVALRRRN